MTNTQTKRPRIETPISPSSTEDERIGQWRCLFYIPVQISQTNLDRLIQQVRKDDNVMAMDSNMLHVSVSRTFSLYYHEIQAMKKDATMALAGICMNFPLTLSASRFVELPGSADSLQGNTRFWGAVVDAGVDELNDIVDALDEVLISFGRQPYYEERIFHVSLASWHGDESRVLPADETAHAPLPSISCGNIGHHVHMKAGHLTYVLK